MFQNLIFTFTCVLFCKLINFPVTKGLLPIPQLPKPVLKINGSELVDKVLAHVRQKVIALRLDPMFLRNLKFLVMKDSISLRNGKIKGLSNIQRAGPLMVSVAFRDTKFRSGFSVTDVEVDQDVQIKTRNASYPNGHIHMDCENVTGYQMNGSELVDKVLAHIRQRIIARRLDPMVIPNLKFLVLKESISLRNGKIKGLSNIQRVGPVMVNVSMRDTKFRSAFSVTDVNVDQDVQIKTRNASYPNGHTHMDCENVTGYQVFKLSHLTQALTLDEFKISVGDFNYKTTGLGEMARKGSKTLTTIIDKTKDPVLTVFNVTFKMLVNVALKALRSALLAAVG
ncbi:unnamed protein product [Orchesella dallaii]|uniref:Uncharacterized protein n=1 Tax=Orchesella dallaii TaxID=48710 RepID=A0ABP1RIM3_9HEXA